jgi:chromosome condensin MukBEF ATPase and DNA-binding subunit MukB
MGYSNDNNPFGDQNLTDKFVWKAKHQKLQESGVDPAQYERELARQRREVLKDEVSKVKARRDEREEVISLHEYSLRPV